MNWKVSCPVILSLFFFGNCTLREGKKQFSKRKPNILFIFTDDQKWNTIEALGNRHIRTPNLDKLTDGAFIFKNAYCFGGNTGAVCIPSRNMLMSGMNFFRFEADANLCREHNIPRREPWFTNPEWPSIPKSMQAAGYETFFREKQGSANNPDIREQFEYRGDIDMVEALRTGRPGKGIVDDALDFIKTKRDAGRPFFMYLGFPCPHDPRWSLKEFRELYVQKNLPVPKNYLPVHPWDIGDMTIRDECLEAWPRTEEAIQRHLHDYYSVISSMDFDIGRLIAGLRDLGLEKNTIIVFSSDQGIAIGDHGLMGKQNIYEGSMKVPLFFKGPGIKQGTTDALVYLYDIFPTLCEFAETDTPRGLDGKSLKPVIEGKQNKLRDNLMLAYRNFQRSVRDDRWKLIHYPDINRSMLFDLANDPDEISNLAYDASYAGKLKEMFGKLEKERKLAGDTITLFPKETIPEKFDFPKVKLPTPFPAGGLAPGTK